MDTCVISVSDNTSHSIVAMESIMLIESPPANERVREIPRPGTHGNGTPTIKYERRLRYARRVRTSLRNT